MSNDTIIDINGCAVFILAGLATLAAALHDLGVTSTGVV